MSSTGIHLVVRIHPRGWKSLAEGGEGKEAITEYIVPFARPLGQPGTNAAAMALTLETIALASREGLDPEQVYVVLKFHKDGVGEGYRTILRRTLVAQLPKRR